MYKFINYRVSRRYILIQIYQLPDITWRLYKLNQIYQLPGLKIIAENKIV